MSVLRSYIQKRISLTLLILLFLIYLIMYTVLSGIELVIRGTSVEVLHLMIVQGIAAGWLLGRTQLKFWPVLFISLLTGFILTPFHIGGLDTAVSDLIKVGFGNLWRWITTENALDLTQLNFSLSVLQSRFQDVILNISILVKDIQSGYAVYNQISTLLTWGLMLWLLACWIAWITRKRNLPIWG